MEVVKTWMVIHRNGRTVLYLLEDGDYVIMTPIFTGSGWTDVPRNISKEEAEDYINKAKI